MFRHKTVLASCHIIDSPQAIPLAAAILKTYQPYKKEVEVVLKNFYLNDSPLKAAETILESNPDSIGFSLYIWNRDFFEKTAKIVKEKNKNIIIYAGGADITASAPSLMDNKNFDYLIRGEGELPFVHLLRYLIGMDNSKPDKLLKMAYLDNLELIPSPFLSSNLNPDNWDGLLWELSRGCPFNCSFCSESRGVKGVRYYSEERIKQELIFFEEHKVEQIFVLDPTFNIDKNRALKIIALIKKHAPLIHFTFEIRAELLDKELAKGFSKLNCSLQIGLQSSRINVLKNVNRSLNPKQFSEKIGLLNKYGAVFGLDLIYGLPGDNLSGFLESLNYALYQIPNHLDIFRLSVFPGTALFEQAEGFNLTYEKKAPYSVISSPEYSESDLKKSEKIAQAVDIFYNKGRAAGWLLSVSDILDISPSIFFIEFSTFLTNHHTVDNPYKLQYQFLGNIFEQQDKTNYLPAALDLCKFHYLYSEALYAESDLKVNTKVQKIDYQKKYRKTSLLQFDTFNYDVNYYAANGIIDIKHLIKYNKREESFALIFFNGYQIETLSVEKQYYRIIEKLNGNKTLANILTSVKIKEGNAKEFISFLLELNLIIPV